MIWILLIGIVYVIWIIYALRNAPEMDDNGNIINRNNDKFPQ